MLTLRPLTSNIHESGYIALYYTQDITLNNNQPYTPEVKVDGVTKSLSVSGDKLTVIHIPSTVYASGSVMTVRLLDYLGTQVGDLYTFNIRHNKDDVMTLAWLNTLGGLDYYTFHKLRVSVTSEKTAFDAVGKRQILSSVRYDDYELYSDFENNANKAFLAELVGSPYIVSSIGELELIEAYFASYTRDLEQMRIVVRPFRTKTR